MNVLSMLKNMCQQVLTDVEIKAICRSRGFSTKEAATRNRFENFFLSDIGVADALASLTPTETAFLHLLRLIAKPVSISFFDRIYREGKIQNRYGTFTNQYQEVFKKVQTSLIRKGVLIIYEADDAFEAKSKMERWRFYFPLEFEKSLPSLFSSPKMIAGNGDTTEALLREKLTEITNLDPSISDKKDELTLRVNNGDLFLGDKIFQIKNLREWQQNCWKSLLPEKKLPLSLIGVVIFAFQQLNATMWILPEELSLLLKVFSNHASHPPARDICEAGWKSGYLARQILDKKSYYRLAGDWHKQLIQTNPETYLKIDKDQAVIVNLKTIPFESLECLTQIAYLKVSGSALQASANIIKLGHAPSIVWSYPLTEWLIKNNPDFHKASEIVKTRSGHQVLHENLMIARVKDLSLKVKIEKAFADKQKTNRIILLPDNFIAFPVNLLEEIEKIVRKSGHVIKTVLPK